MVSGPVNLNDLRINRSQKEARKLSVWGLLGILGILATAGAVGWWLNRATAAEVQVMRIGETAVDQGHMTVLNASGYVTARRQATVSSKVTGKITEVMVEEGMKVTAGQVLARLDETNVTANLRLAEAQRRVAMSSLAETRVRVEEARRDLRRTRDLLGSGIATESQLDRDEAALQALEARLVRQQDEITVTEREVSRWVQQLEDIVIRAPFDGVVIAKNAQPGEMISPISAGGGYTRTGICTVVDMDSLEIEVDVNESNINRVKPGQPVAAVLDAYPEWQIPARVIAIIPAADRQKATVKVRIGFESLEERILPDMGVKVAFQSGHPADSRGTKYTVPQSALRREDGHAVVWIVQENRLERRAVSVGAYRKEWATILSGLSAGEQVVVNGPETLQEGERVKVIKP